jgi:acyl-CoA thioester hydrolase
MSYQFSMKRRIQFAETDMAGIMHFSNFFRLMEETWQAFFLSLGFSVRSAMHEQAMGWPCVEAKCEYYHPLFFEDELEIDLAVSEIKSKTISLVFTFTKENDQEKIEMACGRLTIACVKKKNGQMQSIAIPLEFSRKIKASSPVE